MSDYTKRFYSPIQHLYYGIYVTSTAISGSSNSHLGLQSQISNQGDGNSEYFVQCVNGKTVKQQKYFQVNGDTVYDPDTKLTWQITDSTNKKTWGNAIQYCEYIELGGYSDWRLPNVKDAYTMVDPAQGCGGFDSNVFTVTSGGTNQGMYWTSTAMSSTGA